MLIYETLIVHLATLQFKKVVQSAALEKIVLKRMSFKFKK